MAMSSSSSTPPGSLHYLSQRVEQLDTKMEAMALKVERLPTRDEWAAQLTSKVDVPSYTIAQRSLEEAVRNQGTLITTCQQAIQATSTQLQAELHKSIGDRQLLKEQLEEAKRDIQVLQSAPQAFYKTASFYALAASVALTALCSGSSLILTAVGWFVHH